MAGSHNNSVAVVLAIQYAYEFSVLLVSKVLQLEIPLYVNRSIMTATVVRSI